uniref:Uncharacterized protein n=1 Tax=Sciurus vulgaris TaxID=55149 RepID=A0A8D2AM19_SCIVU
MAFLISAAISVIWSVCASNTFLFASKCLPSSPVKVLQGCIEMHQGRILRLYYDVHVIPTQSVVLSGMYAILGSFVAIL